MDTDELASFIIRKLREEGIDAVAHTATSLPTGDLHLLTFQSGSEYLTVSVRQSLKETATVA